MGNKTIGYSCSTGVPSSKSHGIKVIVLKAFVITKDKNSKERSVIASVWVTNLPIDSSIVSIITKAALAR